MAHALDLTGLRVLIVDDDYAFRALVSRILSEWGAEVVTVENGPRGIVELKRAREEGKPFAVAFLDVTLSGVNGFEVAQRLREQHPDELRRVVLMLGEQPSRHETDRARELGTAALITKPLTRPLLEETIRNVLGSAVSTAEPRPRVDRAPSRVLVAEDSTDSLSLIRHYLNNSRLKIDAAENGKAALDLFRLDDYDLVLMDIQMPLYDGYWSISRMREWERSNGSPRTPIIAVTAYAMTEDAQKCLRAGFDGYLTKPLAKDTLLGAVQRFTRRPSAA